MAHRKSLLLMASALVASMPHISLAQEFFTEEILITARKRAESIQDVPLSVTAFNADQIRRRSIIELEDVALLTPGFTLEDFGGGGFGVPVIRGATQQDITVLEQNVSVFLDGIYIPRAYAFDIGSLDMARIEIVKGPQSALYGQNAFMGAVNYVSQGADASEYGVNGSLSVGTDEWFEASGAVNIPIVEEQVALRLSGAYSTFDGTWTNNHPLADANIPGGTKGNVQGWEQYNFGIQVYVNPVEGLEINASYRRFDIARESGASNRINTGRSGVFQQAPNCGADLGAGPSLFCGTLIGVGDGFEDQFVADPRASGSNTTTDFWSFAASYEVTDAVTLNYTYGNISGTGQQISTLTENALLDPEGEVGFQFVPNGDFDYWQHEARVEYDEGGPLRATFGGFMSKVTDLDTFPLYFPAFAPFFGGGPVPTLDTTPITPDVSNFTVFDATTVVRSKSLFGLVSYGFMDNRLRLTAEARYTSETKDLTDNQSGAMEPRFKDDFVTPRFTVDYQVTENNLLYALAAKGTKAGGINADPGAFGGAGLLPDEKNFEADSNWTYEIGTKNAFMDGRLIVNAALFYIDWSNQQISAFPTIPEGVDLGPAQPPTIVLNVGDATIKGAEISGTFQPIDPLVLNFGASYQDATYSDGVVTQRIQRRGFCDDIVCSTDYSIAGNTLQRSAPYQLNGGFNWQSAFTPLEDVDYFVQADIAWQSKMFVSELNLATIEPRTIVNASMGLEAGNWGVRLWARNLLNKEFVSNSLFISAGATGAEYVPTMGQKRIVGLSLTGQF